MRFQATFTPALGAALTASLVLILGVRSEAQLSPRTSLDETPAASLRQTQWPDIAATLSASGCNWVPGFDDPGVTSGPVFASVVFDDGTGPALYIGGHFQVAGHNTAVYYIAKWNGSSWSALGTGMNDTVYALAVFDDGGGPALYAGGRFTTAGGVSANRVARWNGSTWSALGTGMNSDVWALTVHNDGGGVALYAGGAFTTAGGGGANRIARWNGSTWSALGTGMNNTVRALTVHNDGGGAALYAGGAFTTAGGGGANRIARWNGSTWSALGTGMNNTVLALTVHNDDGGAALYAGGDFTTAGGGGANRIARWNGSTWSALGTGMNNIVHALTVHNDGGGAALYAGGDFTTAGGGGANRIARWNGSTWSALSTGTNGTVLTITEFDDSGGPALFAAGGFQIVGGITVARNIAKWNGSTWSPLGSGGLEFGFALAVYNDGSGPALYAGGSLIFAGGVLSNGIAKWNGSAWSALGTGIEWQGTVNALAVFDDGSGPSLYVGGNFLTAGGVTVGNIARWNGATWSALGSGMNDAVGALAVYDDGGGPALYAGGRFTTAGGISANRIARWNGTAWSALGSGLNSNVNALAAIHTGPTPSLYVGGAFTTAGGGGANRIARWNGSTWSPLGSGISGTSIPHVTALASLDLGGGPDLYVGGAFATAGGVSANSIAKWNGTTWSPLGTGTGYVLSLRVYNDGGGPAMYVGGAFGAAGGVSANSIAKWNGTTWSALGTGIPGGEVYALETYDDGGGSALFAVGYFRDAGGVPSSGMAKWACPVVSCSPPDCNGHGTCDAGSCNCNTGFAGSDCGQCATNYYNYPSCVFCNPATTCSDHGSCNALGGCDCNTGFSGAACNQCAPDHYNYPACTFCQAETTCSGNGACNLLGGCDCDAGWSGPDCSTESQAPQAPTAAPDPHNRRKNRYLSFMPNNGMLSMALRVDKLSAPGGSCWVGAPDATGNAACVSAPLFRVWPEAVVHAGDCEIIPVADYEIRATTDGIVFSPPLAVSTIALPSINGKWWGDVVGNNNGSEWTPPNQITNVQDIVAILAYIGDATIKPTFQQANLSAISVSDSCLNAFVNTADLSSAVRAAAGDVYPFLMDPAACPACP